jgi:hypothetical protein
MGSLREIPPGEKYEEEEKVLCDDPVPTIDYYNTL